MKNKCNVIRSVSEITKDIEYKKIYKDNDLEDLTNSYNKDLINLLDYDSKTESLVITFQKDNGTNVQYNLRNKKDIKLLQNDMKRMKIINDKKIDNLESRFSSEKRNKEKYLKINEI